jgi:hypothetical protein
VQKVSDQSFGTAITVNEEPYRLNGSNSLGKSQNRLSRSGRYQFGENIFLGYDGIPHSLKIPKEKTHMEALHKVGLSVTGKYALNPSRSQTGKNAFYY